MFGRIEYEANWGEHSQLRRCKVLKTVGLTPVHSLLFNRCVKKGKVLAFFLLVGGCVSQDDGGFVVPELDITPPPGQSPSGQSGLGGAYPIVLAHGFGGNAQSFPDSIALAMAQSGAPVIRTEVNPVASVAERGAQLTAQVQAVVTQTGASKVHLVGHSMGGLDSRFVAGQLPGAIASITTISTPHGGSLLADTALGLSGTFGQQSAVLELFAVLTGVDSDNLDLQAALRDLSVNHSPELNALFPSILGSGIVYQSWSGLSTVNGRVNGDAASVCGQLLGNGTIDSLRPILVPTILVTAHGLEGRPSDGVVTVQSADLAGSTFRGCLPGDHLEEPTAYSDADTGFDSVAFYGDMAAELATIQ